MNSAHKTEAIENKSTVLIFNWNKIASNPKFTLLFYNVIDSFSNSSLLIIIYRL